MNTVALAKNILINREPFEVEAVTPHGSATAMLAHMKDGSRIPFHGHTCRATIAIDEVNIIGYPPLPKAVYKSCECRISFNDYPVYLFRSDTAEIAMSLALSYLIRLRALPVDLSSREAIEQRLIGRRVWWRKAAHTIDDFDEGTLLLQWRCQTFQSRRIDILSPEIDWNYSEDFVNAPEVV